MEDRAFARHVRSWFEHDLARDAQVGLADVARPLAGAARLRVGRRSRSGGSGEPAARSRRVARVAGFGAVTATMLPAYLARRAMASAPRASSTRMRDATRGSRPGRDALLAMFGGRRARRRRGAPRPSTAAVTSSSPNHRSTADIPVLLRAFGGHMVSRADTSRVAARGAAARAVGTVFVDRSDAVSGAGAVPRDSQAPRRGRRSSCFRRARPSPTTRSAPSRRARSSRRSTPARTSSPSVSRTPRARARPSSTSRSPRTSRAWPARIRRRSRCASALPIADRQEGARRADPRPHARRSAEPRLRGATHGRRYRLGGARAAPHDGSGDAAPPRPAAGARSLLWGWTLDGPVGGAVGRRPTPFGRPPNVVGWVPPRSRSGHAPPGALP